jgi:hypothetical protein
VDLLRIALDLFLAATVYGLHPIKIPRLSDAAELSAGLSQDRRLVDVVRQ